MISFIVGIVALILGYLIYGKIAEKIFVVKPENKTPAVRIADGVDYVEMSWPRALLIQLLNIAGTGPIFGAIMGAYFGPAAFVWIVFGCIFAGAVHDYFVGMLSVRNDGASISEIVGKYLGKAPLYIMRVFSVVLLILVGVVFVYTPAQVLREMFTGGWTPEKKQIFYFIVLGVIILYYILATMLPIDKLIGRVYPIFGACLLIMALGLTVMLFITGEIRNVPEFAFQNLNPNQGKNIMAHIFPFLFITIACGAISGFHATQSPLMARCLKNEKDGRKVFYLAMILEGIIAMIWAAVAMGHFGTVEGLTKAGSAAVVVTRSSVDLMGWVGGILAVFGVVACPITSGDTAFRSARLTIADSLKFDQKPIKNRFVVAIPLFVIGILLVLFATQNTASFNLVWRYFSWSNQTLATIALWAAAAYLAKTGKQYWITLCPAVFMTVVVTAYFLSAGECLGPLLTKITGSADATYTIGIIIGLALAVALCSLFVSLIGIKQKNTIKD
ncbi:carbon starvation CstA family protein [Leadbettera azotonutricia]|uniref:Carbon starvation protein A n=1 Tax=Leadbettera azotonutricia (strain ATCC BAA-888 / DSM 13862 / ZAS-9) TaxID=545695 RepID=F5Y9D8_LEAAZ|nr:carbon starvation CstA family protein [Leadbettera azotonutricia]AEF80120.1 carbon starvation protein A [Leadbettera azotonutricia ZAS-9]